MRMFVGDGGDQDQLQVCVCVCLCQQQDEGGKKITEKNKIKPVQV